MNTPEEERKLGNDAFSKKNYSLAVEHFTRAISMDRDNPVLYSNRSAAYAALEKYNEALQDADSAILLNPTWVRGHGRRATALHFLKRLREAKEEYEKILAVEPSNENALNCLKEIEAELLKQQMGNEKGMFPSVFLGDVFGKLATDPLTANYYKDKEFVENIKKIQNNPEVFYQLCKDKKIITAAKVLAEQGTKERTQHEKEMDESAKAAAEQEKELGNRDYKSKKFETALKHYQTAMELYPRDATYKSNMSAAYFEMNNFDKCIEICQECLNDARKLNQTNLLPKLLTRIGFAYYRKQDYDKAIEYYQKSLDEQNSEETYNKLAKAMQAKEAAEKAEKTTDPETKEASAKQETQTIPSSTVTAETTTTATNVVAASASEPTDTQVFSTQLPDNNRTKPEFPAAVAPPDPAKREEDRRNTLYRNGQYLSALEAYTGAIVKDPKNASLYVSRAAVYIKLCDYVHGLEDTEIAITLDPKLSK